MTVIIKHFTCIHHRFDLITDPLKSGLLVDKVLGLDLEFVALPLELLLGLTIEGGELAELGVVENEGRQDMLEDTVHLIKTPIFEDRSDQAFKKITEYLWGLEGLKLPLVHGEDLTREGVLEIVSDVFSREEIVLLVVKEAELVQTEDAAHLS